MPTNNQPWICRNIRVTTFHSQLRKASEGSLIQPVFGIEPEAIEIRPQTFVRSEVAPMGPGKVNSVSSMNRVDWFWQVMDDAEGEVGLGSPVEVIESFVPKIESWIEAQADVVRMAIGGQFLVKVASKEDGYLKLDELIDELSVDPETSDLIYQINRPSVCNVDGFAIKINKVYRWSCRTFSVGTFSLSEEQAQVASEVTGTFALCELDFNSDKDNASPFSVNAMKGVLSEIVHSYRLFLCGE